MNELTNPLLIPIWERLEAELQRGDGGCTVDAELLGDPRIAELFRSLLGYPESAIAVSGVKKGTKDSDTFWFAGDLTFLDRPCHASFILSSSDESLVLDLVIPVRGPVTIESLVAKGFWPYDLWDAEHWAGALPAFPLAIFLLDSESPWLKIEANEETGAWVLPMGSAELELGPITSSRIEIRPGQIISGFGSPKDIQSDLRTSLKLGTGPNAPAIPVRVAMPSGAKGWRISLDKHSSLEVGSIDRLAPLTTSSDFGLPESLRALGNARLDGLRLEFAPIEPKAWRLDLEMSVHGGSDAPSWHPIPQVKLEGYGQRELIKIALGATLAQTGQGIRTDVAGTVQGRLNLIGRGTLDATVGFSTSSGELLLSATGSVGSFGFSMVRNYIGGTVSPVTEVLGGLGPTGVLTLEHLLLKLHPGTEEPIASFSTRLSCSSWQLPFEGLTAEGLRLEFEIQRPMSQDRVVWCGLYGKISIGRYPVAFEVTAGTGDGWSMVIGTERGRLDGLTDIESLIPSSEIKGMLPGELPVDAGFVLEELALSYDSTGQGHLSSASVKLLSEVGASWLDGKLSVRDVAIELAAEWPDKTSPTVLTGRVAARFAIAGADFYVEAESPEPGSPWELYGELEATPFSLAEAVGHLADGQALPQRSDFPLDVTIDGAQVRYVPATGGFGLWMQSSTRWPVPFAGTHFGLAMLGGYIRKAGRDAETIGAIYGNFDIGQAKGMAEIAFGTDETDFEISIQLLAGVEADLSSVAGDTLGEADPFARVALPSEFTVPKTVVEVDAILNLSRQRFLVWGQYAAGEVDARYAAVALLIEKRDASDDQAPWGFALVAALGHWTFGALVPGLEGVDRVLGVERVDAAIAISNLNRDVGDLIHRKIPAIPEGLSLEPGLSIYARLDFSGGLLRNVAKILALQPPEGGYRLVGHVDPGNDGGATFTADLGSRTLFSALQLNGIQLNYRYQTAEDPELSLAGQIAIDIGSYSPPPFSSSLVVSSEQALFMAETTETVPTPLGMFGVELSRLGLVARCAFDPNGNVKDVATFFTGDVSIGNFALRTKVLIESGQAKVVVVDMIDTDGRPAVLGVGALLSRLVGYTWPAGRPDIELRDGHLHFAPRQILIDQKIYEAGLHASAKVTILFLPEIVLSVDVYQDREDQLVMLAGAAFTVPLNFFGVIGLTGVENPHAGPRVAIRSYRGEEGTHFGLEAGVTLFQQPTASALIEVESERLSGNLRFDATLPVLGALPALEFTWSEEDGFHVERWPFPALTLPGFSFKNIPATWCEGLEQAILELPIHSSFNASIRFGLSPGQVTLSVGGSFVLYLTSATEGSPTIEVPLVPVDYEVPLPSDDVSWSWVADQIGPTLQNAAAKTFEGLLKNADKIAQILAVEGVKWSIEHVASLFVCSGIERETAQLLAEAATEAVTTELVIDGVTVVVGGVVGTLVGGVFINGGGDNQHHGTDPPTTERPSIPGAPHLSQTGSTLTVTWNSVAADTYVYVVRVSGADNFIHTGETSGTSDSLSITPGMEYSAEVVAARNGFVSKPSPKTELQTIGPPRAPMLAIPELGRSPVELTLTWEAPPGPAGLGYSASLQGHSITPIIGGTTATFADVPITAETQLRAAVHGVSLSSTGPEVEATLTVLPGPDGLELSLHDSVLHARWNPLLAPSDGSGPLEYQALVLDASGLPLVTQPTVEITLQADSVEAKIYGPDLELDQTYGVMVKASVEGAVGLYGDPVTIRFAPIPAPSLHGVFFDSASHTLSGYWEPPEDENLFFELAAFDARGERVFERKPALSETSYDASSLMIGATYEVRLRFWHGQSSSGWSSPLQLHLVELAAPTSIQVENEADTLAVTCDPVDGATDYEVEILDSGGTPLDPPLTGAHDGMPILVRAERLEAGTAYGVRARALHEKGRDPSVWTVLVQGPYSSPPTLFRRSLLPTPTRVEVELHMTGPQLRVSWEQIEESGLTYGFVVLGDGGESVLEVNPAVSGEFHDGAKLLPGRTYTVKVRALKGDDRGAWSHPVEITASAIPAPTISAVTFQETTLTVVCESMPAGADALAVSLLNRQGSPLVFHAVSDPGSLSAVLDLDLLHDSPFAVRAVGVSRQPVPAGSGDSSASVFGLESVPYSFEYKPETPDLKVLIFDNVQKELVATWRHPSEDEHLSFELAVLNTEGPGLPIRVWKPAISGAPYDGSQLEIGTTYRVLVRAWLRQSPGDWSSPLELDLVELAAPASIQVENDADTLAVTCDPVDEATDYQVEILDSEGAPLDPPLTGAHAGHIMSGTPIRLPAQRLEAGTTYGVRARALHEKGRDPSVWTVLVQGPYSSPPTLFRRSLLPTPTRVEVELHMARDLLLVSWEESEESGITYRLVVTGDGGESVLDVNPALPALFDVSEHLSVQTYTVKVQALKGDERGAWSTPVEVTASPIPAPTISAVTFQEATLTVVCESMPAGADALAVSLVNGLGSPLVSNAVSDPGSLSAVLDLDLLDQSPFVARAVGISLQPSPAGAADSSASVFGLESAPYAFDYKPEIPDLKFLIFNNAQKELVAIWEHPSEDEHLSFELKLIDVDSSGPSFPSWKPAISGAPYDGSELLIGTTYRVLVRAWLRQSRGAWSSALELDLVEIAAPTSVRVENEADALAVNCDPVAGATHYEVEILDSEGAPLDPPLTGIHYGHIMSGTPIRLPAQRLQAGATYGARARGVHRKGRDPSLWTVSVQGHYSSPPTLFTRS